jgi:hypothetical protein
VAPALALTNAQVALMAAAQQSQGGISTQSLTVARASAYLDWLKKNEGQAGADAHL